MKRFLKYLPVAAALTAGALFVVCFAGSSFLRMYVQAGIGTCGKIPILCMSPEEEVIEASVDRRYLKELLLYEFPLMNIRLPSGFSVVQEEIKQEYKQEPGAQEETGIIYLLYKEPNFFPGLYPQLNKKIITGNYQFIRHTMLAKLSEIKNLTDTFFVIMKGIFTPNLGDQKKAVMFEFVMPDRKGFINYNLGEKINYFDCNVINDKDEFFKIYIRDTARKLGLEKVLTIISTVKSIS